MVATDGMRKDEHWPIRFPLQAIKQARVVHTYKRQAYCSFLLTGF